MTTDQPKAGFRLWPWTQRVIERGTDTWIRRSYGYQIPGSDFERSWVVYETTNHWTGSITLRKEYLD